ncbi:MAG TPA: tetratricopeptide repeat protein [Polyangiaceae bacterium]|jgi:hypothetical protein|nr:tetratricopeptide repeat protein [Polyangiaceae bacterium]
MTRGGSRLCAIVLAISLAAPAVRADDQRAQATAAFNEGMDLRAGGKTSEALSKLEHAHALYPTAITGLELARTLMLVGRLKDAREALASVARIGPRANESARANNARAEAAALAVEIGTRIPRIRFRRQGAAPAISVDGVAVTDVDSPLEVDPGTHDVVIAGDHRRVVTAEGKIEVIDLAPTAQPKSPVVVVESPHKSNLTAFWIGVAATGASLALGGVSGSVALVNANQAAPECVSNHCDPSVASQVDAAKTWSTVSTISFAALGAFAIFSLVAYFVGHKG